MSEISKIQDLEVQNLETADLKTTNLQLADFKTGKYRHFKGGEYQLLQIATHSETLEPYVVYQALYGEGGIWVRPAAMWFETVNRDGKIQPRFTYIGETENQK